MIHFENVTKKFQDGTTAISNLSLNVEPGEFVSIIGLSGAGKSTLLRLINGMLLPTSGKVHVLGYHLTSDTSQKILCHVRREIGFIFQQFNLIQTHSILSNVLMGRLGYTSTVRGLLGLFSEEDKKAAISFLKEFGLQDLMHKRVDQISGGQQQRVAIARAMVQHPKIILADEPMASLDPKLSEIVLDLLHRFNQELGITVLVNVHVLEHAKRRAKRILGLKKGMIVFDGPPQALTQEKTNLVYGDGS